MIALFIDKVTKQAWTRCAEKVRIPKNANYVTVLYNGNDIEIVFDPAIMDTKSLLVVKEARRTQRYVSLYLGVDANNENLVRVRFAGEDAVDGNLELIADETTPNAKALAEVLANNVGFASEALPENTGEDADEGGDSGLA